MKSNEDNPTPSYIRYLRIDCFIVSLYCNSQLESFLQCKDRLISINATRNVVKKQDNTRTFYYAAVYRSELTGAIILLMEFFANRHDIASLWDISTCFHRDLKFFSGSKCPMSIISVEFSFALMNSVSRAFNDCSLFIYNNLAYRLFIKKEDLPIALVTIASCSVQVIKIFSDKMSLLPKCPKKQLRLFLLNV